MDDKRKVQNRNANKKFRQTHPFYDVKYRFVDVLDYEIIEAKIDDLRRKIENGGYIYGTKL